MPLAAIPASAHPPAKPTSNRAGGKHSLFPHFPKDLNYELCRRTKDTRAPCRQNKTAEFGEFQQTTRFSMKSKSRERHENSVDHLVGHERKTHSLQIYAWSSRERDCKAAFPTCVSPLQSTSSAVKPAPEADMPDVLVSFLCAGFPEVFVSLQWHGEITAIVIILKDLDFVPALGDSHRDRLDMEEDHGLMLTIRP